MKKNKIYEHLKEIREILNKNINKTFTKEILFRKPQRGDKRGLDILNNSKYKRHTGADDGYAR